jgi:putative membrane protein
MSLRMSSFALAAILLGAAACGSQQSPPPSAPSAPSSGMNASGSVGNPSLNEPRASTEPAVATRAFGIAATQAVGQTGSLGVSGAPGPQQLAPGVTDQPHHARPAAGVTNEQGAQPEDISSLNDDQLAGLVLNMHQSEIAMGELAETNASSPAVKRLAEHMVGAHRTLMSHDRTVWSRQRISPNDSALSAQMHSDAEDQMSTLRSQRGAEFDATYVEGQVRGHRDALNLIDKILGAAKNADFKSGLQAERPRLEEHLAQAEQVRDSLRMGAASPQSTTGTQPTRSHDYADGGTK